jgi:hypothetical protein
MVNDCHIGNHPQEELAKFGYRSEREVENFKRDAGAKILGTPPIYQVIIVKLS